MANTRAPEVVIFTANQEKGQQLAAGFTKIDGYQVKGVYSQPDDLLEAQMELGEGYRGLVLVDGSLASQEVRSEAEDMPQDFGQVIEAAARFFPQALLVEEVPFEGLNGFNRMAEDVDSGDIYGEVNMGRTVLDANYISVVPAVFSNPEALVHLVQSGILSFEPQPSALQPAVG